jgi:hypothetical protein
MGTPAFAGPRAADVARWRAFRVDGTCPAAPKPRRAGEGFRLVTRANGEMSQRPYKVEQWSKGFAGVTKLILEAAHPNDAHAEFERVVKHRPRGWYTVRRETQVLREHPRTPPQK